MKRLRVNILSREYDICVGSGILQNSAELIREVYSGKKAAVITDSNVEPLYAEKLLESLRNGGIAAEVICIPAGERSKSLDSLSGIYNRFFDMELTRGDIVIALGGGVVGDLTGYAAATFLRGVPFVQIPTTLLAQVDSSVGGKVAVNHERGKNMIGAFYQPKLVISDVECLKTLDKREFAGGMGEVIKHGAIADAEFFGRLENRSIDMIETVVLNCDIKRKVVEQDEYDTGLRMMLNFGHTFGHALEKHYNFERYTHGEAVAIGMVQACELGERLGVTKPDTSKRLTKLLEAYDLPTSAEVDAKTLLGNMLLDKKRGGDSITFVLLEEIGRCRLQKIGIGELEEIL